MIAAWFVAISFAIMRTLPGAEEGYRDLDPLGALLTLSQTGPLVLRRRAPIAVFLAMMFGGVVPYSAIGYATNTGPLLATVVAFFTVIERSQLRLSLAMTIAAAFGVSLYYAGSREAIDNPFTEAVDVVGAFGLAWLLGTFVRWRRDQSSADAAELVRLEAESELVARAAVADERASIARELHDAVGQALNLVVIQAGAAQRVIAARPGHAAEALASIESTGRQALTDMDRMVGVLREGAGEAASAAAAPGLQRLDALIEQTREAGLPVEKVVEGTPTALPRTVDLSAYRIIQEGLTNSLKHAGAAHANVRVQYLDDAVELEVTDDGAGADAGGGGGRGRIGMRERVRLFRGELEAGSRPEGGYRVRARLPLASGTS